MPARFNEFEAGQHRVDACVRSVENGDRRVENRRRRDHAKTYGEDEERACYLTGEEVFEDGILWLRVRWKGEQWTDWVPACHVKEAPTALHTALPSTPCSPEQARFFYQCLGAGIREKLTPSGVVVSFPMYVSLAVFRSLSSRNFTNKELEERIGEGCWYLSSNSTDPLVTYIVDGTFSIKIRKKCIKSNTLVQKKDNTFQILDKKDDSLLKITIKFTKNHFRAPLFKERFLKK